MPRIHFLCNVRLTKPKRSWIRQNTARPFPSPSCHDRTHTEPQHRKEPNTRKLFSLLPNLHFIATPRLPPNPDLILELHLLNHNPPQLPCSQSSHHHQPPSPSPSPIPKLTLPPPLTPQSTPFSHHPHRFQKLTAQRPSRFFCRSHPSHPSLPLTVLQI